MKNLAIIGVGALGRRHLQSMVELDEDYQIHAVEINEAMFPALNEEFPNVEFITTVDQLPREIELVVIATNSNVRRALFEQLINHSNVKNIIFEKVLFQRQEDYYFVMEKLNELNISAWVNCARREWNSYKQIHDEVKDCSEFHISAIGGRWGLGCNCIHILDLIEYISGDEIQTLDMTGLENRIVESKRKGFYEFFGTVTGKAGKCRDYSITCIDNSLPFCVEITTEKSRYIIHEGRNYMMVCDDKSNWQWTKRDFKQDYQSQMTARVVKSILDNGTCNLPDYESSMTLHLKYILPLIDFFKANGMEENLCPIT